jgi:hypothetical protein
MDKYLENAKDAYDDASDAYQALVDYRTDHIVALYKANKDDPNVTANLITLTNKIETLISTTLPFYQNRCLVAYKNAFDLQESVGTKKNYSADINTIIEYNSKMNDPTKNNCVSSRNPTSTVKNTGQLYTSIMTLKENTRLDTADHTRLGDPKNDPAPPPVDWLTIIEDWFSNRQNQAIVALFVVFIAIVAIMLLSGGKKNDE